MSDERAGTRGTESPEEAAVRELLEGAGRRPAPPEEDLAAIRAAARREWEELVAARRRGRWRQVAPLALAAVLVAAVALGWWWRTRDAAPPAAAERVATVQLVTGNVQVRAAQELAAGAVVRTGRGGRAALRLEGDASVRLDEASAVRLASASRLELESGALYVDSAPDGAGALEIATPFGSVREIGTQFEVRVAGDDQEALRVRVREGTVAVARRGGAERVAAGEELAVRRDGRVRRAPVAPHGPAWDWVLAAAPGFDIEGATLAEYLGWLARETGWRVVYEDPSLAALAGTIRLHGTIAGMAPDESASVVLPGSGLAWELAGGTLRIR